jgi:hypothetical protein
VTDGTDLENKKTSKNNELPFTLFYSSIAITIRYHTLFQSPAGINIKGQKEVSPGFEPRSQESEP